MGKKPLYIVKFCGIPEEEPYYSGKYFSLDVNWDGVPKEQASKMTKKEAVLVCNQLRRHKIATKLEEV
jgi:hypothetical protein